MTTSTPQKPKKKVDSPSKIKKKTPEKKRPNLFVKAWRKLDDWNVGLSGKIMIILIIIGVLGKMAEKL